MPAQKPNLSNLSLTDKGVAEATPFFAQKRTRMALVGRCVCVDNQRWRTEKPRNAVD